MIHTSMLTFVGLGLHDEYDVSLRGEKAIREAMERHNGNLTLVAKSLNISRPTLYNKLKKYGI